MEITDDRVKFKCLTAGAASDVQHILVDDVGALRSAGGVFPAEAELSRVAHLPGCADAKEVLAVEVGISARGLASKGSISPEQGGFKMCLLLHL